MVGTIILVLSEGFDDMAFLSCQVILEESNYDVIVTSEEGGAIKGEDSSVISVSFDEAFSQNIDYSGLIIVGGRNIEWNRLDDTLRSYKDLGKKIGAIAEGTNILQSLFTNNKFSSDSNVIVDNNIITLFNPDNSESFVDQFVQELN
jgi:putative intracellular protease/amidase